MNLRRIAAWSVGVVAIVCVSSGAKASSFTLTNLGDDFSYSTDANGNRIIVASDGQKYAFPGSSPQHWTLGSLTKIGAPMPFVESNPYSANYSSFNLWGGLSNQNGDFVSSVTIYHQYQSGHLYPNEILSFRQMPDGTFGPAQIVYNQDGHDSDSAAWLQDINKNNQVLAQVHNPFNSGVIRSLLIDINTGKSTILPYGLTVDPSSVDPIFTRWNLDLAIAIDDQGRVLFESDRQVNGRTESGHILLTPEGLSNAISTPEPSTLTMTTIALVGVAFRRLIKRRISRSELPVG